MTNGLSKKKFIFTIRDASGNLNLFSLITPILIENIGIHALSTVSTVLLSGVSGDATAATGVVTPIISVLNCFSTLVSSGLAVLLSYALGRGDKDEAKRLIGTSITVAAAISAILSIIVVAFSNPILSLITMTETVAPLAKSYFKIRAYFLIIPAITQVLTAALRCYGDTKPTAICGLVSNAVNMILAVMLLRGNNLDIPTVVDGMAYIVAIGQLAGLIIAVFFTIKKLPKPTKFIAEKAVSIIKIGFPSICGVLSYTVSSAITTAIISSLGTDAVNTKVYVSAIVVYVPLISQSMTSATSVMLGRLFGVKDIENGKRLVRQNVIIGMLANLLLSVTAFIFCNPLLRIFTDNPEILRMGRLVMLVDIIVEVFRAANNILANSALVTAKDIVFAAVFGIVSCWLISVGGCRVLSIDLGLGIIGCWIAFGGDEFVRAIGHIIRWKSGVWEKRVLNHK